MNRRFLRMIDCTSILMVTWAVAAILPLSFWFQPGSLIIASTDYDKQPALVIYDRKISRRVFMSYSVVVHRLVPDIVACDAKSGPFWYEPRRELPPPSEMTLAWLAPSDARCGGLPPGEYVAEVCWSATVLGGLVPTKTVCVQSNPFTIRE